MPLPPHVQARRECLSFVVLGATGNLAQRKLLPSLFNLHANGHLPPRTRIVCSGRPDHTDESFREITAASLVQFFNTTPKPSASTSAGVPRQDSVTAGIDDLDAEFRGVLNGAPAPAPVVTSRDIGGCALTTARSSSFVNLEHLAADGNTDDVAANPANASILARRAVGAARAARQDAPEFLIRDFLECVRYARVAECVDCDSHGGLSEVFALVAEHETRHADAHGRNRLYYLALPHELYLSVARAVHLSGRSDRPPGWTRIVVEKPFGSDLPSARAMHAALRVHWAERDLYRIDRYLGKEVIDNLLVMRFANRLLTPIWNRENIANVQIIFKARARARTALFLPPALPFPGSIADPGRANPSLSSAQEPIGTTAEYFDKHGIVRDVMQNHLLQVMAVLAMDRPVSLDPEDIRDAKLKVLRQVTRVDPAKDVVAGQYVASDGKPGYRDNASVADGSRTPTYAMVVLNVRNERWDGVPFILKAGKALNEKRSEIRIQLRSTPGDIFAEDDGQSSGREGPDGADLGAGPNEFVLRIQPHEEMYMKLTIKEPGLGVQPVPSEMELSGRWRAEQERKEVAGEAPRRAYERLILDAVNGHQAHFVRGDELEAAWAIVDPINAAIESGAIPMHEYAFGTRGPEAADELRRSTGHVASPVPRDGVALSSSDDHLDARGDGTPTKKGARGLPASSVWGRDGDEEPVPMPPAA